MDDDPKRRLFLEEYIRFLLSRGEIYPQKVYSITFETGEFVLIFGVRNFTLNQYLGSVDRNVDKNSVFGSTNLSFISIIITF